MLKAPPIPCGSCPYRRDVPSGIWSQEEYDKLPKYDGDTMEQARALFLCHQRDGCLCGGWLACHDPQHLLAIRLAMFRDEISEDVWNYWTAVPVFTSGAEARAHGMRGIQRPPPKARKMIAGLTKKLGV